MPKKEERARPQPAWEENQPDAWSNRHSTGVLPSLAPLVETLLPGAEPITLPVDPAAFSILEARAGVPSRLQAVPSEAPSPASALGATSPPPARLEAPARPPEPAVPAQGTALMRVGTPAQRSALQVPPARVVYELLSKEGADWLTVLRPRYGALRAVAGRTRSAEDLIAEAFGEVNAERSRSHQDALPPGFLPIARAYLAGWGALEGLRVSGVTDLMIGARSTVVARAGQLEVVGDGWDGEAICVYVEQMGGPKPTPALPIVDWLMPDGSRGNATHPAAGEGTLCVRQHPQISLTARDLLASGTLTQETWRFLQAAMEAKLNIVIAGATGSGKTSFAKVCMEAIPPHQRLIIIEQEFPELPDPSGLISFVRWHSGRPTADSAEYLTMGQLVTNALRQRPDRIIVGECRGGEVLAMLEAANTGHEGTLTTVHANSAADTILRLTTLAMRANPQLTVAQVERELAATFHLVVFLERREQGAYLLKEILQVAQSPEAGQHLACSPLYTSVLEHGRSVPRRSAALLDPRIAERFAQRGLSTNW